VTVEWAEPDEEETDNGRGRRGRGRRQVYVPVWVCTDPEAAGLHYAYDVGHPRSAATTRHGTKRMRRAAGEAEAEARREAESAERRRVIANNKAWKAAEVVRREWLTGLFEPTHRPQRGRGLIARAVIGMRIQPQPRLQHGHGPPATLLGIKAGEGDAEGPYTATGRVRPHHRAATTPKAATCAPSPLSWRPGRSAAEPTPGATPAQWDAVVMTALTGWGYPASDVEQLLLPATPTTRTD
jgi:ParB family chromosome partitioning protein